MIVKKRAAFFCNSKYFIKNIDLFFLVFLFRFDVFKGVVFYIFDKPALLFFLFIVWRRSHANINRIGFKSLQNFKHISFYDRV